MQVDSTLVLLLEDDVGWSLVHSDPEPFQLVLQDFLVAERLQHVQHNKDDVGGSCHCDNLGKERMWTCEQISSHLSATAFAVLGSLYDSRQIKKLDLGSLSSFFIDFQWEEHYFEFKKAFALRKREWVGGFPEVCS